MSNVLVTGGTGGIGAAIVSVFETAGCTVYAPTREQLDLESDFKLDRVEFDIVINNAGINPLLSIADVSDSKVMAVNYFAPLRVIQQCLPHMIRYRYGRIVNIGSIWGELAKKNRSAYSASKSALDSLSRSLTAEYAEYNILTNTVSPGFIDTKLTHENNSRRDLEKIISTIPLKRLGTPFEIARLVYSLTVNNNYISGQNIIIDGGFSCTR